MKKLFSLCRIFGHRWMYKDYTNAVNRFGKKYNFSATRFCSRCDKKEYKFAEWTDEKVVPKTEVDLF